MPVLIKLVEIRGDSSIVDIFTDEDPATPSRVELKEGESLTIHTMAEKILNGMMRNAKTGES